MIFSIRNRSFRSTLKLLALLSCCMVPAVAWAQEPKAESTSKEKGIELFDGKTLDGWKGLKEIWRVEDGAITGENTAENPIKNNTFLVYDKPVSDFELECEFKISGGNSGIQYRSKVIDQDQFIVGGYQADIDSQKRFMGINYEERGRGILVERGEIANIDASGKKSIVGTCGDSTALQSRFNVEDWNKYRIVVKGNICQHYINGTLMSELHDDQEDKRAKEGVLALQLHQGPPMKVQFKNIVLFQ